MDGLADKYGNAAYYYNSEATTVLRTVKINNIESVEIGYQISNIAFQILLTNKKMFVILISEHGYLNLDIRFRY
ncbi:hypothetical protein CAT7_11010 [Carnobacterium sp. AT7]|nr:hypothetical protein CAT7_11010 [Carnobacterium sp. AT7]